MKRTFTAWLLVILFVLSTATPVFALPWVPIMHWGETYNRVPSTGEMTHIADYEMDGLIDYRKQAGHFCNTGAELKQIITGEGLVDKTMDIHIVGGKIAVDDSNELTTAPDAVSNLEITSVIQLCALPKSLFTEEGALYASLVAMMNELFNEIIRDLVANGDLNEEDMDRILESFPKYLEEGVVPPWWGYLDNLISGIDIDGRGYYSESEEMLLHLMAIFGAIIQFDLFDFYLFDKGPDHEAIVEIMSKLEKVIEGRVAITEPLTRQIWAASVSADPGHTATLNQDFEAAYGPWGGISVPLGGRNKNLDPFGPLELNGNRSKIILEDFFFFGKPLDDSFWFDFTDYPDIAVKSGPDYVGNYFTIDQYAFTSQGVARRYIDISSPWGHGYLMENMTVTGAAEVSEAFSMENLEPGSDTQVDWWVLF